MTSPVLSPLYVCVSTNFVMAVIKCAYCLKLQILSQWGPFAAPVAGALMLVLPEFYLLNLHKFCTTSDPMELYLMIRLSEPQSEMI